MRSKPEAPLRSTTPTAPSARAEPDGAGGTTRFGTYAAALLAAAVPLGVVAFRLELVSDDWGIVESAARAAGNPLQGLFAKNWAGEEGVGGWYRPVTLATVMASFLAVGYASWHYHISNIGIHVANSLIFVAFVGRFLQVRDLTAACVSGFIFFAIPIHTDNVFWLAGRTDTVCASFYMLSCVWMSKYMRGGRSSALAMCAAAELLALCSKEMAFSLPMLLALYAFCHRCDGGRNRALMALGATAILLAAALCLRYYATGQILTPSVNIDALSIRGAIRSLYHSRAIFSLPRNCTIQLQAIMPILIVAACLVQLARHHDRRAAITFTCMCYLVSMVPIIGLVMRWYLYIPSIMACGIVAQLIGFEPVTSRYRRAAHIICTITAMYFYYYLVYDSGVWLRASDAARSQITALTEACRVGRGMLILVNVPATFAPSDTIGEKPLFAYHLDAALRIRGGLASDELPTVANYVHFWDLGWPICPTSPRASGTYAVHCSYPGFFSLHTQEFVFAAQQGLREVTFPWGTVRVDDLRALELRLSPLRNDIRLLAFDGASWRQPPPAP